MRSSSQFLSRSGSRAKKSARHRTGEDETGEQARGPQGSSRAVDFCHRVAFFSELEEKSFGDRIADMQQKLAPKVDATLV